VLLSELEQFAGGSSLVANEAAYPSAKYIRGQREIGGNAFWLSVRGIGW
jgi:hypothetical protein